MIKEKEAPAGLREIRKASIERIQRIASDNLDVIGFGRIADLSRGWSAQTQDKGNIAVINGWVEQVLSDYPLHAMSALAILFEAARIERISDVLMKGYFVEVPDSEGGVDKWPTVGPVDTLEVFVNKFGSHYESIASAEKAYEQARLSLFSAYGYEAIRAPRMSSNELVVLSLATMRAALMHLKGLAEGIKAQEVINKLDVLIEAVQASPKHSDILKELKFHLADDRVEDLTGIVGAMPGHLSMLTALHLYILKSAFVLYGKEVRRLKNIHIVSFRSVGGDWLDFSFYGAIDCMREFVKRFSHLYKNHPDEVVYKDYQTFQMAVKAKYGEKPISMPDANRVRIFEEAVIGLVEAE